MSNREKDKREAENIQDQEGEREKPLPTIAGAWAPTPTLKRWDPIEARITMSGLSSLSKTTLNFLSSLQPTVFIDPGGPHSSKYPRDLFPHLPYPKIKNIYQALRHSTIHKNCQNLFFLFCLFLNFYSQLVVLHLNKQSHKILSPHTPSQIHVTVVQQWPRVTHAYH